jgi:hypothetical protein
MTQPWVTLWVFFFFLITLLFKNFNLKIRVNLKFYKKLVVYIMVILSLLTSKN